MSIDRSDANLAFGNSERIGEIRRVERDAPAKQGGQEKDRNGRERESGEPPVLMVPKDVVEISPAHPSSESDSSPAPRQVDSTSKDHERHLDIKV
jgi:hypothetical protein